MNWRALVTIELDSLRKLESVVIFVTYNLSEDACNLISFLRTQRENFDIIVLDNGSELVHYHRVETALRGMSNIMLLRSNLNYGGAGGYSLLVKAALDLSYNFILITEDDAVPTSEYLVDNLLKSRSQSARSVVEFLNNGSESFSFHFHLYPRVLLMASGGGPDFNLFQIDDDLEFAWRVEKAEDKLGFSKPIFLTEEGYYHPLVKKSVGRPFTIYLTCRNRLYITNKHNKKLLNSLKLCYGWSIYSWTFLFLEQKLIGIHAFNSAILDFLLDRVSTDQNLSRMKFYSRFLLNLNLDKRGGFERLISEKDISLLVKEKSPVVCSQRLYKSIRTAEKLNVRNLARILFYGKAVVVTSYFSPLLPLLLFAKEIILVERINPLTGELHIRVEENDRSFAWILGVSGLIIGSLNFLLMLPLIVFRFVFRSK